MAAFETEIEKTRSEMVFAIDFSGDSPRRIRCSGLFPAKVRDWEKVALIGVSCRRHHYVFGLNRMALRGREEMIAVGRFAPASLSTQNYYWKNAGFSANLPPC